MALEQRGYDVLKVIGKGAFGQAVLVRHHSNSVAFVAKEIDMTNMSKRDIDGSRNEVAVLAQLDHPNITKFIESFEVGNTIYIIMEYADGGDLAAKIKHQKRELRRPFSEEQILAYFIQICLALKHLHKKHILHRDLKTMNIFLTSSDVVKLGDFGVSKQLGTVGVANTVCGTPYYFSPEMCRNEPYSSKCDVWSLGVVLYELIMLTKPFQAKDIKSLMQVIVTGVFQPLNPKLGHSQELYDLCCSLLSLDPNQRPGIPQIMSSAYMQRNLKNFARSIREKEAQQASLAKQRASSGAPAPSPSSPTQQAPSAASPTSMKMGKVKAKDLQAMLSAPPPEYQQDIQKSKEQVSQPQQPQQPKLGSATPGVPDGCVPDFEKTVADCKHMVELANVAHQEDGSEKLIVDKNSGGQDSQSLDQVKELLHAKLGKDKLNLCVGIYNKFGTDGDESELLQNLQGVLGKDALQMAPLIEKYIFLSK